MFENVLVGVDGRPNGRDAIALAGRISAPEAKLTLVHVHPGPLDPLHVVVPGVVREERDSSHELLERERSAAGVDAELLSLVAASPGRGLHDQAEELGADLLVVGSSARGVLGRVRLGDDTRASLNGSPCAVAIASRGYDERPAPLARIGVGYDGSEESKRALAAARAIAERSRSALRAMRVVDLPAAAYMGLVAQVTGDTIETMLAEAREELQALDGVEGVAVYGLVGEELAAFGDELDLLVVGSRSYGPWQRLVLGSTSNFLERHARCSLLVLPRAARSTDAEAS